MCVVTFRVRQKFIPLVDTNLYDWHDPEQRELLRSILMTACDIATITKPWPVQRKVSYSDMPVQRKLINL